MLLSAIYLFFPFFLSSHRFLSLLFSLFLLLSFPYIRVEKWIWINYLFFMMKLVTYLEKFTITLLLFFTLTRSRFTRLLFLSRTYTHTSYFIYISTVSHFTLGVINITFSPWNTKLTEPFTQTFILCSAVSAYEWVTWLNVCVCVCVCVAAMKARCSTFSLVHIVYARWKWWWWREKRRKKRWKYILSIFRKHLYNLRTFLSLIPVACVRAIHEVRCTSTNQCV